LPEKRITAFFQAIWILVVQSSSATAEQSAAASEDLSNQSKLLKEKVGRFRLRTII
jgi:hypothetical protein